MQTFGVETLVVGNITGLYSVRVARISIARSTAEVSALLQAWPGQVAIGGGRYSMGGQVAVQDGLHIDLRQLNQLVWLRPSERVVRVQAGIRWRDLQDHLDPFGLAVKTMQSYSNFTVGGSISVNVHGRYVGHGPIGHSVRALQLVLADGSIIESSRTAHAELFSAAIGGYGAVGVITEVELDVAPTTCASSGRCKAFRCSRTSITSRRRCLRTLARYCTTPTCCRRRSTPRQRDLASSA